MDIGENKFKNHFGHSRKNSVFILAFLIAGSLSDANLARELLRHRKFLPGAGDVDPLLPASEIIAVRVAVAEFDRPLAQRREGIFAVIVWRHPAQEMPFARKAVAVVVHIPIRQVADPHLDIGLRGR